MWRQDARPARCPAPTALAGSPALHMLRPYVVPCCAGPCGPPPCRWARSCCTVRQKQRRAWPAWLEVGPQPAWLAPLPGTHRPRCAPSAAAPQRPGGGPSACHALTPCRALPRPRAPPSGISSWWANLDPVQPSGPGPGDSRAGGSGVGPRAAPPANVDDAAAALGLEAGETLLESFGCVLWQTYTATNNFFTPVRQVRGGQQTGVGM